MAKYCRQYVSKRPEMQKVWWMTPLNQHTQEACLDSSQCMRYLLLSSCEGIRNFVKWLFFAVTKHNLTTWPSTQISARICN